MLKLVGFLVLLTGVLVSAAPSPGVGPRIVGGKNATRGQYPFIVSLNFCVRNACQHSCGGALITNSWIVSAAHCITQVPSQGVYKAIAGVLSLDATNSERQEIKISHAFLVPEYEGAAGPHDLAIFKTVSPFTFNELIQPVRLVPDGADYEGPAELVGWGSIGGAVSPIMPSVLQTVSVNILSYRACEAALDNIITNHPLDYFANTCTGPITGEIAACTGDSGTPLVQNNILMGVVSWIITPCGTVGAPSIQTKVSYYRRWIVANIDEALPY